MLCYAIPGTCDTYQVPGTALNYRTAAYRVPGTALPHMCSISQLSVVFHFYLLLAVYTRYSSTIQTGSRTASHVLAAVLLRGIYANFTFFDVFWCPFSVADQLNHRHMVTLLLPVQRRF